MSSESKTLTSDTLPELELENTRTAKSINWIIKYLRGLAASTGGSAHVIQDDGADMPQREHLNFSGDGVQVLDYPGTDRTTVLIAGAPGPGDAGADIRIGGGLTQRAGNGVLLFSGAGALLAEYAADATGLAAALAAAASGDVVEVPAGTITDDPTIGAGVTLKGRSWASIIAGLVTGGAASRLRSLAVTRTANQVGILAGVTVGATGTFYLEDVKVDVQNSGGPAYAVYMTAGGNIRVNGDLLAEVGTDGYAGWVSNGDFYPDTGLHKGTVAFTPYWKE